MNESTLASLQRRFKTDILTGTNEFSTSERMDVYRRTKSLVVEFIASDYPILGEKIGQDRLEQLIEDYLRAHPSTFTNKSDVSSGFSQYLKELGEDLLSEIARFDWMQVLSSAEPEPPDFLPIGQMTADDFRLDGLLLDPSLRLFESTFAVHESNEPKHCFLVIRSLSHAIQIENLEENRFRLLQTIVEKRELNSVTLSESDIVTSFSTWVQDGTIIGFIKP